MIHKNSHKTTTDKAASYKPNVYFV